MAHSKLYEQILALKNLRHGNPRMPTRRQLEIRKTYSDLLLLAEKYERGELLDDIESDWYDNGKYYRITADNSDTTCEICRLADGMVFPTSFKREEITAEPFHYNCKCRTNDEFEPTQAERDELVSPNDEPHGRIINIPNSISGKVNEESVTIYPSTKWFSYQGSAAVIDEDGFYIIIVGPKVLDPNYSDKGKIWADDFDLPVRIDAVLVHIGTTEKKTIQCIVYRGGKAHTYNKFPDSHEINEWYSEDTAEFDVENGLHQTGIVYPKAENRKFESQFAKNHMDGSTVEFVGRELGFNPGDYILEKLIVFD